MVHFGYYLEVPMGPLQLVIPLLLLVLLAWGIRSARSSPGGGTFVAFTTTVNSTHSVVESRAWAITSFASALRQEGYNIESQSEQQLTFTKNYRSRGTWLFTILLFPIGLLFFVAFKHVANITMLLSATATGSQ